MPNKFEAFEPDATAGEKYGPAMEITDPNDAREYFNRLVEYAMHYGGYSQDEAERIQRSNLGYYAGYYDGETANRVNELFGARHPVFGTDYH